MAWHIAALERMRELPDLADLTGETIPEPNPEDAAEQNLAALRLWARVTRPVEPDAA